jgi:uncharacterized membrane protein YkoI
MTMRLKKGVPAIGMLAMVALFAFAPMVASARHDKNHTDSNEPPRSTAGISKDQAIEIAQRRYKARVVRAEAADNGGRRVYVLRMLSDEGRVWTVRIDAQTGSEF